MISATWTVVKRSATIRGKMSDVTRAMIIGAAREEKLYTHKDIATMPWHLRGKIPSDDEEVTAGRSGHVVFTANSSPSVRCCDTTVRIGGWECHYNSNV